MDETYLSFLRLLDDDTLVSYIKSLSQDAHGTPAKTRLSQQEARPTSTPNKLVRSFESDPFDDSLDHVLLGLDGQALPQKVSRQSSLKQPSTSSLNGVPGNQLAAADTDLDAEADETFGDVGPLHQFGDYGTYFHNKHLKQQKADEAYVQWDNERKRVLGQDAESSTIFAGCVIFVNGNTVPSLGEIHKLVILHGGKFLNYLNNKGAATHIICDRLTPRKKMQFRNYKVVKAKWIADSVEQGKLLDWKNYRLIDVLDYDQGRLGFANISKDEEMDIDDASMDLEDELSGVDEFEDLENAIENDIAGELSEEEPEMEEEVEEHIDQENNEVGIDKPTEKLQLDLNVAQNRSHNAMDAKHPDFLKHFFANSRLHHLSTWKADLRSKFLRSIAQEELKAPVAHSATAEPIILHLDFDCFFATASALARPDLDINKDPIAVSHGGKSSDVASCNYVARKKGVTNGSWLGQAQKKCPELIVLDYDFNAYETYSNAFYNYLIGRRIFDSIFPVLIDEALVDASSYCSSNNQTVDQLCEEIRADIFNATRCTVSIGASKNVLLAKLANRKAKPNGHFFLNENIDEFLSKTKVRELPGIGRSISGRLANELQIMSSEKSVLIEDVKPMSLTKLMGIFGEKTGMKIHDYCRGHDPTKIKLDLSSSEVLLGRKTVSVDVNFGIRFDTFQQAESFLMSLAKELHTRLIDLGVCGSAMTLKLARRAAGAPINPPKYLGMGFCDFFSKSSKMGVPTNDWGIIGSEMRALFRILNIPVQELRGIAVSMSKLEDIQAVKNGRQQRLEFNQPRAPRKKIVEEEPMPGVFAHTVVNSESVDWDVFNQLPDDIRRELKLELLRRGIPVSRKELSPKKKGQSEKDCKVYLQQMFPTQPNGEFKLARVYQSPSKKKRKIGNSPIKNNLPVKRTESPTPYNDTVSYDEAVLNEIPSSIRNEFMEELEWQRKNKRLGFVSMKEKMEQKNFDRKLIVESEITPGWLAAQPRLVEYSTFANLSDFTETSTQVRQWVKLSVADEGPHPEDVNLFCEFLMELARQGNVPRCLNLLKCVEREIQAQSNMVKLVQISPKEKEKYVNGIKDWLKQYNTNLKKAVLEFCRNSNIEVNL